MTDDPALSIGRIVEDATPLDLPPLEHDHDDDPPPPPHGHDGPREPREDGSFDAHVREYERRLERCAPLLPNDTDNGRRLREWFGEHVYFVRDVGWHIWTGRYWDPLGGAEAVHRLAQRTATLIAAETRFIRHTDQELADVDEGRAAARVAPEQRTSEHEASIKAAEAARSALSKRRHQRRAFSVSSGNGARISQMMMQTAPHLTIPVDAMDADPLRFNVENGTLVFEGSEPDPECPDPNIKRRTWSVRLAPHQREDRIAKIAPAIYDPDARRPRFDAFLHRFQPNPALRRFLQVYHGYSILGVMGAQKLVFNYGEGANGKSTFIEAICRLMGPYARTLNAESLTGTSQRPGAQASPDLAQLPGARLVRVSELPRGEPLRENLVKSLTGGEPMMVRHNYGNFFEFRPAFKPSMSGNDKPKIDGVDHGIWRRVALVVWGVTISDEERRDFEEVLSEFAAERSGILNWLVEGALIYLSEGLFVPQEVSEATRQYRADMDQVQGFVDACVHRTGREADEVASRALYMAYESYCLANAMKPWSEKAFSTTMVKKGFLKIDGRIRMFRGLTLHDVPACPDDEPRNPRWDDPR